jgi:hypothetical protein
VTRSPACEQGRAIGLTRLPSVAAAVEGPACTLVGWAALTQLISMLGASVAVAYSTHRLVTQRALRDRELFRMIAGTWVVSGLVGVAFVEGGIVGNFKDIYCCVAAKDYKAWAVGSTLAFIIGAATATTCLYVLSFRHLATMELTNTTQSIAVVKASYIVVRRGSMLVGLIYFWWSLIIIANIMTALGYAVPASLDMFGAILVKFCPIFDSVFIMRMLRKISDKRAQVAHRSRVSEAANESRTGPTPYRMSTTTLQKSVLRAPPQEQGRRSPVSARPGAPCYYPSPAKS